MNKKQVKKRKKWPWVLGGLVLVIAAAVVLLPYLTPAQTISNAVIVPIARGSITETVVGTGILEEREDDEIVEATVQMPVGIKVEKVFFDIDDDVSKGDVLATVDPLSLQQRIVSVQNEIEVLNTQISRSKDDTDDKYIKAGVSGRIIKIFVEKGDVVSDVMSGHGALMLISIDGTVEEEIAVVGTTGTVKTIHVSENEKVSKNRRLITLEDLPPTIEYQQMLADRAELVEILNTLIKLAQTHSIYATADGTVSGVSVFDDTISAVSAENSPQSSSDENRLLMDAFTVELEQIDDADVFFAIEVDELDILSIQVGQDVNLVFNALPDREFTGTICEIASESHSQSGVAKYTVEVSLTKDESMRIGMNATATISISSKTDILILPMEALQEFGNSIFVYTQRDEQTGELSGMKPVETGVSDGAIVEILSGLSEGEMVYFLPKTSNNDQGFVTGGPMPIGVRQGPQTQQGGGMREQGVGR